MALFYDRDYGHGWHHGYDRGYRGATGWGGHGYEGTGRGMYGGGYGEADRWNRYDRGYKSRWQTDYGDPFGDRVAHTPIRMTHGEYRGDRGFGWRSDYDRGYSANPAGYDPYFDRSRFMSADRWNRYDRDWGTRVGRHRPRGYEEWF
jgi:hypothetical protein